MYLGAALTDSDELQGLESAVLENVFKDAIVLRTNGEKYKRWLLKDYSPLLEIPPK